MSSQTMQDDPEQSLLTMRAYVSELSISFPSLSASWSHGVNLCLDYVFRNF